MRSGNGRHRRPRQAPAFFVAAGVTGAGIAMPLLGAGAAQASDSATWDRVAECESGGMWSSDPGNGYYGGLQMSQESWEQNGGLDLADRPDLASRSQQISVAERILAAKGPRAWPACAVTAGLGDASKETPDRGSKPGEKPAPEAPSDTTSDTPSDDASDSERDDRTPPTSEAPETDAPSERPGDRDRDERDGKSERDGKGDSADEDATSDRSERSSGGKRSAKPSPSADRDTGDQDRRDEGTGKHRGAPDAREGDRGGPDRSSRDQDGGDAKQGRDGDDYRVKTGDSLSAIAADLDLDGGWTALYDDNRDTVGTDPDLILPGQRLAL